MAINNSREFLAAFTSGGVVVTDHLIFGGNREIPPGAYTPILDPEQYDSVTFVGTGGRDTLVGGGGEIFTFFLGSAGNDLYGVDFPPDTYTSAYVDYSGARKGVVVDMSFRGSQTFTDESGDVRTVEIFGRAWDGFGGVDSFMEARSPDFSGFSSVLGVFGTSHRDVMTGDGEFFGGGGNDLLTGGFICRGGEGNDRLIGRATGDFQFFAAGDEGNDFLLGTEFGDFRFTGGAGNDRIFAGGGNDRYVVGEAGNDYVDGGAGNDFIDGGVDADILVSGSGNDTLNPDVEFFQTNSEQATDGARDVIRVTGDDRGDNTDFVLSRAFESGTDQVRFRDAVVGGFDYRLFYEARSANETGFISGDDRAEIQNTVLQIDQNGDGFGDGAVDRTDYLLVLRDVTLTEHGGFLLT